MITAIFSFIYLLFNIKKLINISKVKKLLVSIVVTLLISSYYLVPMIENTLNTKYEVYSDGKMSTSESVNFHRLDFVNLITSKNHFQVHEIGLVTIASIILGLFTFKKIKKEDLNTYICFFIFGIISVLLSTKIINWETLPKSFLMIQFPWRFLEFSSYFFSVISGINLYNFLKKNINYKDVFIIVGILLICTVALKNNIRYSDEKLERIRPRRSY